MIISGKNSVLELIKTNPERIKNILISQKFPEKEILKREHLRIEKTNDMHLAKLTNRKDHQGIVAIIKDFQFSNVEDLLKNKKEKNIVLILDKILDPRNLGTIIRVAECSGTLGIIIPKHNIAKIGEGAYKSAEGALEHVQIAQTPNLVQAINKLKQNGFWIVGAEEDACDTYTSLKYETDIGLVIGGEHTGLSRLVKENCDFLVKIPMYGNINSLNAANACGIIIYEILRQRNELIN
jgi:23S rRNA (guanosine2251-2'-O)-methyltransferase